MLGLFVCFIVTRIPLSKSILVVILNQCRKYIARPCPTVGLLSQISPFRYFPTFETWNIAFIMDRCRSLRLRCIDTSQIWMYFSETKRYFYNPPPPPLEDKENISICAFIIQIRNIRFASVVCFAANQVDEYTVCKCCLFCCKPGWWFVNDLHLF